MPARLPNRRRRPLALENLEDRQLLARFFVTDPGDTFNVLSGEPTEGTLRWAITEANQTPGLDEILFTLPASPPNTRGVPAPGFNPEHQTWTIQPVLPLPEIVDPVIIDGYHQAQTGVAYYYPAQLSSTVQALSLSSGVSDGSLTLSVPGFAGTSAVIPYNAGADLVRAALEGVVGIGNVSVSGGPLPGAAMTTAFVGALAGRPVGTIQADSSGLVGGQATISLLTEGGSAAAEPKIIFSSPNTRPPLDGYNAKIRVVLDGQLIGSSGGSPTRGLVLNTSHSNIRGLAIVGFDVGIEIPGAGNIGNRVQGNAIGAYVTYSVNPQTGEPLPGGQGIALIANQPNRSHGVVVGSTNAAIGGPNPQETNVIAMNQGWGVWLQSGSEGGLVQGNQIGVVGPIEGVYFSAGNALGGVLVQSSSNAIGGAVAGTGNAISSNGGHGVFIVGQEATRNRVEGNYIGLAPGGGYRFGASSPGNRGDGVRIENAPSNRVGGTLEAQRNAITASGGAGVRIAGPASSGNLLLGNFIGLTASGNAVLGNAGEGVRIELGAGSNTVGAGNVISGNLAGVAIVGPGTSGNEVAGSLIGTDLTGRIDLGNTRQGILVEMSSGNRISGSEAEPQVISGNNVGIELRGSASTGNLLTGNRIGTDKEGKLGLGNAQQGVLVDGAPRNTIGGAAAGAGNVMSANHWGIELRGSGATGNTVEGNRVGVDLSGKAPLPNEVDGVRITLGASSNTIGGATVEAGNTVAFNRRTGIRVEGPSLRNALLTNSIFDNAALGIDLAADGELPSGVSPNDPLDADVGPNQLQNVPVLTLVRSALAFSNLVGTVPGMPGGVYRVQFFASGQADPSGSGEGKRYLGETWAVADPSGLALFSADVPGVISAGESVTATATDADGNTSEFSAGLSEVLGALAFAVASYEVEEGARSATITVVRIGGSGGQVQVNYATAGGTATPGVDYQPVSGTLSFDIGVHELTFSVPILEDGLAEASETIGLVLSMPQGAATLGTLRQATLTIRDNDQPGAFSFASPIYTVSEASPAAVVTVVRDQAGGTVSVAYATAGGSAVPGVDYLPVSGVLTFGPGELSKTFAVPIVFNAASVRDSEVTLVLTSPSGGATLGTPAFSTLRIQNVAGPRVVAVVAVPGPRGGTSAIVLTFDQDLDPVRAVDLRNYGYSLQIPGRGGNRVGTPRDFLLGLRSAVYDASLRTVTLTPVRPIAAGTPILVQVNQVTDVSSAAVGVANTKGELLDGNNDGLPGGAFRAEVRSPRPVRRWIPLGPRWPRR